MASAYNSHNLHNRERALGEVFNDFKQELKDFFNTRVQMLKSEMNEKVGAVKTAAPSLVIAAVFAWTGWVLLSFAFVFLLSMAFQGKSYQYAAAFGIVAVVYLLIGAIAGMYGYRTIASRSFAPERTIRVLKQDQVWLQTEAKTQL